MTVFVGEAAQRVSMTLPLKVAPKQALRIFIELYRENSKIAGLNAQSKFKIFHCGKSNNFFLSRKTATPFRKTLKNQRDRF
jgi:hypothetical protein